MIILDYLSGASIITKVVKRKAGVSELERKDDCGDGNRRINGYVMKGHGFRSEDSL